MKLKSLYLCLSILLLSTVETGVVQAADKSLSRQENMEARRFLTQATILQKSGKPDQAKALLGQKDIPFEEKKIGDGYTKEELLEAIPTARTVPQIIIDGQLIGGFTELKQFLTKAA